MIIRVQEEIFSAKQWIDFTQNEDRSFKRTFKHNTQNYKNYTENF